MNVPNLTVILNRTGAQIYAEVGRLSQLGCRRSGMQTDGENKPKPAMSV